jgi:quercetin dioxygenase-like cupin family protein
VLQRASVVKLVTPRLAPARFGQFLVQMSPRGGTDGELPPGQEHFLYVLEGRLTVGSGTELVRLEEGGFVYLPPDETMSFLADRGGPGALMLWLKRSYEPATHFDVPGLVTGNRADAAFTGTVTEGVRRLELLPVDDPARDFAMSILRFDAGCGLPQVEIHDEEHGAVDDRRWRYVPPRRRGCGRGAQRLHLHGAVLPAVLRRGVRGRGVPGVQGRLARRVLIRPSHTGREPRCSRHGYG